MKFKQYIKEAGQKAGNVEVAKITVEEARKWAEDKGFDLDKELPNFDKNFKEAQRKARQGWTVRKDMPVIETDDVKKLQKRLKEGNLDINRPYSEDTLESNPFPQGLTGEEAKEFIKKGFKDGTKKDDVIQSKLSKVRVGDLKPIQKQIYFDKSMGETIKGGVEKSKDFVSNKSFLIMSKDKYIIDGHHRFMSGMLIDPDMKVNVLEIDLPLDKLLPLTLAYGDAIGNKRNL